MARAYVGTSGWSYKHWGGGVFYPEDAKPRELLRYYAQVFDTVEVNSSFYHMPQEKTMCGWRERSPDEFVFALKASRYITHRLHLRDAGEPFDLLWSRCQLLGGKLGPVLFQLPPSLKCDLAVLSDFLALLPGKGRFTFEFRHESWFRADIYELLGAHNAALTVSDTPRYPCVPLATADFAYVRLHGHEKLYVSNYRDEQLREWADRATGWIEQGREVYCYFDNDAEGHAPRNALTLRRMVAGQ